MTIITIISHPKRDGLVSTMAENAVVAQEFDVRCENEELSFTEQAAILRAAADQLDGQQAEASNEV